MAIFSLCCSAATRKRMSALLAKAGITVARADPVEGPSPSHHNAYSPTYAGERSGYCRSRKHAFVTMKCGHPAQRLRRSWLRAAQQM